MDVELPDGTVVEGVPDGLSQRDLVSMLSKNGHDTSWYEAPAPGLIDRAAALISGKGEPVSDSEKERIAGQMDAERRRFTAQQSGEPRSGSVMRGYVPEEPDANAGVPVESGLGPMREDYYQGTRAGLLSAPIQVQGQLAQNYDQAVRSGRGGDQVGKVAAESLPGRVDRLEREVQGDTQARTAQDFIDDAGQGRTSRIDGELTSGEVLAMSREAQGGRRDTSKPEGFEVFTNAVMRGIYNNSAMMAGLAAAGAKAVGADDLSLSLLRETFSAQAEAGKYGAQIKDFTHIKSWSDVPTYALEGIVENAPQLIGSIGSGVVGGLIAKNLGAKAVAGMMREQAQKELLKRVAIGSAAGAGAASVGMETGSIYGDIARETGEQRPGVAAAFGVAAGALDAIPAFRAARTVLGDTVAKQATSSVVKRYGKEALIQLGAEGGTEFVQTLIEKGAVSYVDGKPVFTEKNMIEAVDAMLKGGIAGAAVGVGSMGISDAGRAVSGRNQDLTAGMQFDQNQIDAAARQSLDPANAQMQQIGRPAPRVAPAATPADILNTSTIDAAIAVADAATRPAAAAPSFTPAQSPAFPAPADSDINAQLATLQDIEGTPDGHQLATGSTPPVAAPGLAQEGADLPGSGTAQPNLGTVAPVPGNPAAGVAGQGGGQPGVVGSDGATALDSNPSQNVTGSTDKSSLSVQPVGVPGAQPVAPAASTEKLPGTRDVAQRQVNAVEKFVGSAVEQFGLSREEAGAAWDHLVKNKLVKIDAIGGQYNLKDGRLWDGDVLRKAAGVEVKPTPVAPAAEVGAGSTALDALYDVAVQPGRSGNQAYSAYRQLSTEEADALQSKTGIDVRGFRHGVDEAAIRHILKEHGNSAGEESRNQVAVTREDFLRVPEITDPAKADSVEAGQPQADGLQTIVYRKRYNGYTYVVEEVRTGRQRLALKTMWKVRAAPRATPEEGVAHTPEAFGTQPSTGNSNIAQETPNAQEVPREIKATKSGKLEISGFTAAEIKEAAGDMQVDVRIGANGIALVTAKGGRHGTPIPFSKTQEKTLRDGLLGKAVKAPRKPAYDTGTLLGAIRSMGGIALSEMEDITGESNRRNAGGGDLFRDGGQSIDEIARALAEDFGFGIDMNSRDDNGGVNQAAELIRSALGGVEVLSMDRMEQAAHKSDVMDRADNLGVKTKFRKFSAIELDVLKLEEQKQKADEARLDETESAAYDEVLERAYKVLGDDRVQDALEELAGKYEAMGARDYQRAAREYFEGLIHAELQQAAEGQAGAFSQAGGEQAGAGGTEAPGVRQPTKSYGLEAHTAEDLAERQARIEAAEKEKAKLEAELAKQQSALNKPVGTATRPKADQNDLFNDQGSLFQRARKYADPNQLDLFLSQQPTRPGEDTAEGRAARLGLATEHLVRGAKGSILGLALSTDWIAGKGSSLLGKRVTSPADLATLGAVLRDPRAETMRYFLVKDGNIIYHTAVSSRLPGSTALAVGDVDTFLAEIKATSERLGADGYYLMHNHPSRLVEASKNDIQATEKIANTIPGFLGHVILDHTEFGLVDYKVDGYRRKLGFGDLGAQPLKVTGADPTRKAIPHPKLDEKVANPSALASVANMVRSPKNVVLVAVDGRLSITGIMEVSPDDMKAGNLTAYKNMVRLRKAAGSETLFAILPQGMQFGDLHKMIVDRGWLMDANYLVAMPFSDGTTKRVGVNASERSNLGKGRLIGRRDRTGTVDQPQARYGEADLFADMQQAEREEIAKAKQKNSPQMDMFAALEKSSEKSPAVPVAESQVPAPSEPGDLGVAPKQGGVAADMAPWEMDFGLMGKYTYEPINRAPVPDGGKLIASQIIPRKIKVSKDFARRYELSSDKIYAFRVSVVENAKGERYSVAEYMDTDQRRGDKVLAHFEQMKSDQIEAREFASISNAARKLWEANKSGGDMFSDQAQPTESKTIAEASTPDLLRAVAARMEEADAAKVASEGGKPVATDKYAAKQKHWDERASKWGMDKILEEARDAVAGNFIGREFNESAESFYARNDDARATRDWVKAKEEKVGAGETVEDAGRKVSAFVQQVLDGKPHPHSIVVNLATPIKREKVLAETGIDIKGAREILIEDTAVHVDNRHPNMTLDDWALLPEIAESFDKSYLGEQQGDPRTQRIVFVRKDAPHNYVYVAEFASGKQYGDRLILRTFFKDTPRSVEDFIAKHTKEVGASVGAGESSQPASSASNLVAPGANIAQQPAEGNTEDAGEELTYNRRNRMTRGLKWEDIADKNVALRVKEVTKAKVFPKPDYQALVDDGTNPLIAHLVKQVYDAIATAPSMGRRQVPTDADMRLYIDAVNRVMAGVEAWATDRAAVAKWAARQANGAAAMMGKPTNLADLESVNSLLDTVYPGGWKNYRQEVILLGGNKLLGALQPGYDETQRAIKDIKKGWPGKRESWQQQGYRVLQADDEVVRVRPTNVEGRYFIEIDGKHQTTFPDKASADKAASDLDPWLLLDKRGQVVSGHPSEAAATEAARAKAERKNKEGEIHDKGRSVESAERTGPARRMDGEDISSDKLKDAFGFKGINFGTWMKGDSASKTAERQLHLNHAYDAFLDLAEILNVPPKAMGLNGMLGLAIGAQGSGKHLAHFVPGVNEINLTRTGGAGALAHEFGHALDHYFATLGGLDRERRPYLTEHTSKPAESGLRPEIVAKFKAIVEAMSKRKETMAEAEARSKTRSEQYEKQVNGWLKYVRQQFESATKPGTANMEAVRAGALIDFDKLADRVRNLDLGEGKVAISRDLAISPVVDEMREAFKAAFGRVLPVDSVKSLQANIDALEYTKANIETKHSPQQVTTDYQKESNLADKGKVATKLYWSTKLEMFARAFDAFVVDTLAEKAAKNSYLAGIEAVAPQGEERKAINQAFSELVAEIKTKETGKGVAMFSQSQEPLANPITESVLKSKFAESVGPKLIPALEKQGKVKFITAEEAGNAVGAFNNPDISYSKDGRPLAFYLDGVTYFIPENIPATFTADEAHGLLKHEIGTHAMNLGRDSKEFAQILKSLEMYRKLKNKQVLAAFQRAEDAGTSPGNMNEEALGYLVENSPQSTIAQKFLAWFKQQVNRLIGGRWSYTPADLVAMAESALRRADRMGWAEGEGAMSSMANGRTAFAHNFLQELAASEPDVFRYPTSNAKTLEGVFKDVFPGVTSYGEHTLPEERRDTGADHRYIFQTPDTQAKGDKPERQGKQFTVFTTDDGRVWIDVSKFKPGDQGSRVYAAVANYAHNAKKAFGGDPVGVSPDAIMARTKMMLSSALRHGTTDHLDASPEQEKGIPDAGIEPLKWYGKDIDRMRALIHTFVGTAMNRAPKLNDYHYDFTRKGFFDRAGGKVSELQLLDATRAGQPGASGMGADSGRAAILIQSLISAEGRGVGDGGILQDVLDNPRALVDGGLRAMFSKAPPLGGVPASGRQQSLPVTAAQPPAPPTRQTPLGLAGGANGIPAWNIEPNSQWKDFVYKFQNKYIDLKDAIAAIKAMGIQIRDAFNPYLQEELYHKRVGKRTSDFFESEFKPLLVEMRLRGVTREAFEEYLHARHAKEANKLIRDRGGMDDGGSGMTDQEATDYFANLDPKALAKYQALSVRVDTMLAATRKTLVDYGLESAGTINGWANMFAHYVPLNREDMDHGQGVGQGFSVRGPAAKHRTGSSRKVADILGNIAQQRDRAIVRGEKNRVAVALYGLAFTNPNPDLWEAGKVPTTQTLDKNGQIVTAIDPNYKNRDNVIVARIKDSKGEVHDRAVVFNDRDERAMRLAAAMKNLDAPHLEGLIGISGKITRYFASMSTQYNPVFIFVNFARDFQTVAINLSSTPLKGKQTEVMSHALSATIGIYADLRDHRAGKVPTSKWAQLYEEMQLEGGTTGYRDMFANANERTADQVEKLLDPEWWAKTKWGKAITVGGLLKAPEQFLVSGPGAALFNWLSDANETAENAMRLAVYKTAIDHGISKAQAASLAKNCSVNFNRKGSIGAQMNAAYAFFNAAAQGTARMMETLTGPAGKQIVAGGILLGVVQALAMMVAGFDDDDPPKFVREKSLIIPIGDKKYVSIPMPLGFHFLPNIGRISTELAMRGFKKPGEAAFDMISMLAEAFNPIGNSGLSLQTLAPTPLDPLVAIAENKDWTGKPIARKDFSGTNPTPGHTRAKDTASAFGKAISEGLNWATGGTQYKSGFMSPTPDQIDYLTGQVFGGVGREAMKAEQTVSATLSGEELPPYKVPLLGRVYGKAEGQAHESSRFYDNIKALNEHEAEIKGRRKDGGDVAEYRKEYPEASLVEMANRVEREVAFLRRQKRDLLKREASKEAIKLKEQQITARMKRLNDAVEARQAAAR